MSDYGDRVWEKMHGSWYLLSSEHVERMCDVVAVGFYVRPDGEITFARIGPEDAIVQWCNETNDIEGVRNLLGRAMSIANPDWDPHVLNMIHSSKGFLGAWLREEGLL